MLGVMFVWQRIIHTWYIAFDPQLYFLPTRVMFVLQCVVDTWQISFDPQLYFLPTRVVCFAVYDTHVAHLLRPAAVLPTDTCYAFIAVYGTHVVHRCRRPAVLPIPGTAFSTTVLASLWNWADLRCHNCCLLHLIWNSLRKRRACRNQQELFRGVSRD